MQYAIVLVLTAIHNEALWSVFEVEDFLWILADSLYFPLNLLTLILRVAFIFKLLGLPLLYRRSSLFYYHIFQFS